MILSDLLTLELYFSSVESALFFEESVRKYGHETVKKCITAGEIVARKIYIGPDAGRTLLCLTEKGRLKVF
ncbi:MAG: hypothetical protein ACRBCT_08435 [Alphaproteobacteria bacterium]